MGQTWGSQAARSSERYGLSLALLPRSTPTTPRPRRRVAHIKAISGIGVAALGLTLAGCSSESEPGSPGELEVVNGQPPSVTVEQVIQALNDNGFTCTAEEGKPEKTLYSYRTQDCTPTPGTVNQGVDSSVGLHRHRVRRAGPGLPG